MILLLSEALFKHFFGPGHVGSGGGKAGQHHRFRVDLCFLQDILSVFPRRLIIISSRQKKRQLLIGLRSYNLKTGKDQEKTSSSGLARFQRASA